MSTSEFQLDEKRGQFQQYGSWGIYIVRVNGKGQQKTEKTHERSLAMLSIALRQLP